MMTMSAKPTELKENLSVSKALRENGKRQEEELNGI
jgi:hypothetical protein